MAMFLIPFVLSATTAAVAFAQEEDVQYFNFAADDPVNGTIIIDVVLLYQAEEGKLLNRVTLAVAEEALRADKVISDNIKFRYHLRTVNGLTDHQEARGVELYFRQQADVIIGPPQSAATIPIAQLANYWDLPIFGYMATFKEFSDKSAYKTLVRVCPTMDQIGEVLVLLGRRHQWTNMAFIYGKLLEVTVTGSIMPVIRNKNSNITVVCEYSLDLTENATLLYQEALTCIKKSARVVFVYLGGDPVTARAFMLAAQNAGMTDNGDYAYIIPNGFKSKLTQTDPWLAGDAFDGAAQRAFRSTVILEIAGSELQSHQFMDGVVRARARAPPFDKSRNDELERNEMLSITVPTRRVNLYNTMYLYGKSLNTCMSINTSYYRSGRRLLECSGPQKFKGPVGFDVYMSAGGERDVIFLIQSFDANGMLTTKLKQNLAVQRSCGTLLSANYSAAENFTTRAPPHVEDCGDTLIQLEPFKWPSPSGELPANSPPCGYLGEKCQQSANLVQIVTPTVVLAVAVVACFCAAVLYRARKARLAEVANIVWRIDPKQLLPIKAPTGTSTPSFASGGNEVEKDPKSFSVSSTRRNTTASSGSGQNTLTLPQQDEGSDPFVLALYKEDIVRLKTFSNPTAASFILNLNQLRVLKCIFDAGNQENLNTLLGIAVNATDASLVWQCNGMKGSLKAVLLNADIKLDVAFKSTLLRDVVNGLEYLHSRPLLGYHGFLRSCTCMVTNRWAVQLSDYAIPQLLGDSFDKGVFPHESMTFAKPNSLAEGKAKDIHDFAVILYEVITRTECVDALPFESKIDHLTSLDNSKHPFLLNGNPKNIHRSNEELIKLFAKCQSQYWDERPNISVVREVLRKYTHKSTNLVDHMMGIMERYAGNLESLVSERTAQLQEERRRSDNLIYQLLPRSIADNLKQGLTIFPEFYEQTSVYFNDIVGFTSICSESSPIEVIDMLNKLYQQFDAIIGLHDCYKVETIGDAYLVVSGAPKRNGDKHAEEIAQMALQIIKFTRQDFEIPHQPGRRLQIRIGIHSGPLAAGVIGLSMPKYCLFGDTVNVASRMESSGEANKIQISWATKSLLSPKAKYTITPRGEIPVKGKGMCETFWLDS